MLCRMLNGTTASHRAAEMDHAVATHAIIAAGAYNDQENNVYISTDQCGLLADLCAFIEYVVTVYVTIVGSLDFELFSR